MRPVRQFRGGAGWLLGCALVAAVGCGGIPWPDPVTSVADGTRPDHRPNDYAVVVAIEDYMELPRVRGAVANGEDWIRYFRTVRRLAPDRIARVFDARATEEGIERALRRAVAETASGGRVWFIFIGHGTARMKPNKGGHHEGLLVGVDARRNTQSIEGNSVSQARIAQLLGDRESVLVLDACFSGADRRNRTMVSDLGLKIVELDRVPAGVVLTAAASDETAALLSKSLRPAFSFAALGALQGWCEGRYDDAPADGRITGEDVRRCADEIIAKVNWDKHHPQAIVSKERAGEVVLAEGISPGYDLDAMLKAVNDAGPPSRAGPIAMVGLGSAALAAGIGAHIVNVLDHETLRAMSVETEADRVQHNDLRGSLDTSRAVAISGYAVGGVLLVGGIAWRLALVDEDEDWLAFSPSPNGLVVVGSF